MSYVWKYFSKQPGGQSARCSIKNCGVVRKCNGGSTQGMRGHLERVHQLFDPTKRIQPSTNQPSTSQQASEPAVKKQKLITEYSMTSFEEQISFEVAAIGSSFQAVVKSPLIAAGVVKLFPTRNLPKNGSDVAAIVRGYYEEVKAETVKMFEAHIKEGKLFSATLDEWTSTAGRRYLNINVHFIQDGEMKEICLGLIPIHGKADAPKSKELVSFEFFF